MFRRHKLAARDRGIAAVKEVLEKSGGKPTVESVLEAFARAAEKRKAQDEARSWVMLIYRELVEPQLGARFLLVEVLEPLQQALSEALAAACPGLSAKTLNLCIHSFLAQLAHSDVLYYVAKLIGLFRQSKAIEKTLDYSKMKEWEDDEDD